MGERVGKLFLDARFVDRRLDRRRRCVRAGQDDLLPGEDQVGIVGRPQVGSVLLDHLGPVRGDLGVGGVAPHRVLEPFLGQPPEVVTGLDLHDAGAGGVGSGADHGVGREQQRPAGSELRGRPVEQGPVGHLPSGVQGSDLGPSFGVPEVFGGELAQGVAAAGGDRRLVVPRRRRRHRVEAATIGRAETDASSRRRVLDAAGGHELSVVDRLGHRVQVGQRNRRRRSGRRGEQRHEQRSPHQQRADHRLHAPDRRESARHTVACQCGRLDDDGRRDDQPRQPRHDEERLDPCVGRDMAGAEREPDGIAAGNRDLPGRATGPPQGGRDTDEEDRDGRGGTERAETVMTIGKVGAH